MDSGYALEPPRRGGSNDYPRSVLRSENKKKEYPGKSPVFYYTKVRCMGLKSQKHVMLMLKQMHGQVAHQCRHTRAFVSYFFDETCSILSSMSVSLF